MIKNTLKFSLLIVLMPFVLKAADYPVESVKQAIPEHIDAQPESVVPPHPNHNELLQNLTDEEENDIRQKVKGRFQKYQMNKDDHDEVKGKVKEKMKENYHSISEDVKAELEEYHRKRKELYYSLSEEAKQHLQKMKKTKNNSSDKYKRMKQKEMKHKKQFADMSE